MRLPYSQLHCGCGCQQSMRLYAVAVIRFITSPNIPVLTHSWNPRIRNQHLLHLFICVVTSFGKKLNLATFEGRRRVWKSGHFWRKEKGSANHSPEKARKLSIRSYDIFNLKISGNFYTIVWVFLCAICIPFSAIFWN